MIEVDEIHDRIGHIDEELDVNQKLVDNIDKNLDKMDLKMNKINV